MSDNDVYTAEKILKMRNHRGVTQYLIKWKDFPPSANTWEPIDNVLDESLLDTFWEERKSKRRKGRGKAKRPVKKTRQSQSQSPARSVESRQTPESISPEPSQLVLDESAESDRTIDDESIQQESTNGVSSREENTPEQPVQSERPEQPVKSEQHLDQPKMLMEPKQPTLSTQLTRFARSPTPQRAILWHSPSPAKQEPINNHSLPIQQTPIQKLTPKTHQSPLVVNRLLHATSSTPIKADLNGTSHIGNPTVSIPEVPPARKPMIRHTPATTTQVVQNSQIIIRETKSLPQSNIKNKTSKNQPSSKIPEVTPRQMNNNHQVPIIQFIPPAVLPKNRKSAVMTTMVTEVSLNDKTVTISESKTGHGFFREASRRSVDATTQLNVVSVEAVDASNRLSTRKP